MEDLPPRVHRLPRLAGTGHLDVRVADTFTARLMGLAGLASLPRSTGLLLPGTRSVHTVGMRFGLDLLWLDTTGLVVRVDAAIAPGRLSACRTARGVVEFDARHGGTPLPRPGDHLLWPPPPVGAVGSDRDAGRRFPPAPRGRRNRP